MLYLGRVMNGLARTVLRVSSVVWLACSATPATALGQGRIELIPQVGSFLPLSDFGSVQYSGYSASYRQSIGVLAGARLRVELPSRWALEAGASYVETGWTETATFNSAEIGQSLPGGMVVGEFRVTYRPRRSNAYAILGVAYSSRFGDAWDAEFWDSEFRDDPAFNEDGPTIYDTDNFAGVLGVGLRAQASASFAIDVSLEVHLASVQRVQQGFTLQPGVDFENKGFQADLFLKVGVPIVLKR